MSVNVHYPAEETIEYLQQRVNALEKYHDETNKKISDVFWKLTKMKNKEGVSDVQKKEIESIIYQLIK